MLDTRVVLYKAIAGLALLSMPFPAPTHYHNTLTTPFLFHKCSNSPRGRTQSAHTLTSAASTAGTEEEEHEAKHSHEVQGNPWVDKFEGTPENPAILHGFTIAALFRTRPELAELVALKMQVSVALSLGLG